MREAYANFLPTVSLHSTQGRMIMDVLKALNGPVTKIIQVTHNPEYARYGHRTIQLQDGWVVDPEPAALASS